jgi:hypothetical protein
MLVMALPPPARDILVSLLAFSLRRVSTAFSTIDSRFLKGCLVRAPDCCVRPPQRFTSILTVTPSRPNNCGTVSLVWLFSASVVDAATLPPKRATLGTRPKQRPRCPPLAWLSAVHSTPEQQEFAHHHGASGTFSSLPLAARRILHSQSRLPRSGPWPFASIRSAACSRASHRRLPRSELVPLIRRFAAPFTDWVR